MSLRSKLLKFWNLWPPFLFTGIKIVKVSDNYDYVKVMLKLRFWNANYVGTQFGGSIFAMADPFYMVMLLKNLGKGYIVWDKSATIHYLKPGRTHLIAEFKITPEELETIRHDVEENGKTEILRNVDIFDCEGILVAKVEKVIYIRKSKA